MRRAGLGTNGIERLCALVGQLHDRILEIGKKKLALLENSGWVRRALAWYLEGGRRVRWPRRFFDVGDGPSNKPCRQLGDWKEAQDANVQYTDDFITSMFLYRTRTIGFHPNGLPHGPKSKSKSSAKRKSTKLCKHHRKQGPRSSTCNLQSCSAHCNSERTWAFSHTRALGHIGNRLLPSLYLAVPVSNEDGDRHEMFRNTWVA